MAYLDEGHGGDSVSGAEDTADHHELGEGEGLEDVSIDEEEEGGHGDEANNGADDAQESDHSKVFEEQRLAQAVPGREDDRRQDDREEQLV